ncbi:MAG: cytochrome c, partial [Rhodobacteraceae bacterium]|nr:cytochrome c [Paracoccaceae bacterium]
MLKFLKVSIIIALFSTPAIAGEIGRIATPDEVAAWNIDIRPDGLGLPEGSGTVAQGEEIFEGKCAACHGDFGEGVGRFPVLAGGFDTLTSERPIKTVGSFWPYLSTVWDYINRAMPFGNAQSLSADEVYALTAYIMFLNEIVDDETFELSKANFLDLPLRNEANFYPDDRPTTEYPIFRDTCMANCKPSV